MTFHWPQIIWCVFTLLGLGMSIIVSTRKRNGVIHFLSTLIATLITAWLLWCGGFFSQAQAAEQPPTLSLKYRSEVIRAARVDWGLNAPVADFAAQLHQESGWNPMARSPVGAQGMAQFMPATADWISKAMPHLQDNQPYNPAWAVRALVSYDRWLWQRIKAADECERMAMVLSAYNGGLGWLNRDKKLAGQVGLNPWVWFGHVESRNAGRSLRNWKENRNYPKRILLILAPRYLSWGGASCVG